MSILNFTIICLVSEILCHQKSYCLVAKTIFYFSILWLRYQQLVFQFLQDRIPFISVLDQRRSTEFIVSMIIILGVVFHNSINFPTWKTPKLDKYTAKVEWYKWTQINTPTPHQIKGHEMDTNEYHKLSFGIFITYNGCWLQI